MSLKSFPNNIDDRRVVWCLSQDTIDTALNDKSTSELLLAPNVTVIQLPLSRIAKRKSDKLCELDKLGLLKVDQVLVCSDEGLNTQEKYLNLEEVIDDFLTYNQKKIALFDFFPEEFREPCDNGEINLIFSKIKSRLKDLEIDVYIFYIHNEKDNAYRLLDLINKQLNIKKINIDLEREIGHILGYEEKDIDFYIDKIQKAK